MKSIVSSVFRLAACGIQAIGLALCAPILGTSPIILVRTLEAPDCISNLTIRVASNPSHITYGQSSVVSWFVDLPPECGYTSVKLNNKPIAASGRQIVYPSQNTTYRVTVFFNLHGVPGEKTESTRIIVGDASVNPFCPDLPQPYFVEIWEAESLMDRKQQDPLGQSLTKMLEFPKTSILLGPEVILNMSSASNNDIPFSISPGITLMSVCAFLPADPAPRLNDLITSEKDPAA